LIGDESVEIGIGEPGSPALLSTADVDATKRTGSDVTVQRLDRAVQLGGGLRGGLEPVR